MELKNKLINNIEKIVKELQKGNDVIIKPCKGGVKIQSSRVKTIDINT